MTTLTLIAESFVDRHLGSHAKLLVIGNSPSDGKGLVSGSYAVVLAHPGQA